MSPFSASATTGETASNTPHDLSPFPGITNDEPLETKPQVDRALSLIHARLNEVANGYSGIFKDKVNDPKAQYWNAIAAAFERYSYPETDGTPSTNGFDGGSHGPGHLLRVMFLSLYVYNQLPAHLKQEVDIRVVIMAAAYHDIWSSERKHNLKVWWMEGEFSAKIFDTVQDKFHFSNRFHGQTRHAILNHPGRKKRKPGVMTPELVLLSMADVLDQNTIGRWHDYIRNQHEGLTSFVSFVATQRRINNRANDAQNGKLGHYHDAGLIISNGRRPNFDRGRWLMMQFVLCQNPGLMRMLHNGYAPGMQTHPGNNPYPSFITYAGWISTAILNALIEKTDAYLVEQVIPEAMLTPQHV